MTPVIAKVEWLNMRTSEVRVKLLDGTTTTRLWDTAHPLPFVGDTVRVDGLLTARPTRHTSYDTLAAIQDMGPIEALLIGLGALPDHLERDYCYSGRPGASSEYLRRRTVSVWWMGRERIEIKREER